jgi:hypothetical protein
VLINPIIRARTRHSRHAYHPTREVGWGGMDSIDLAQDTDQWSVREQGKEPSGSIKSGQILE